MCVGCPWVRDFIGTVIYTMLHIRPKPLYGILEPLKMTSAVGGEGDTIIHWNGGSGNIELRVNKIILFRYGLPIVPRLGSC